MRLSVVRKGSLTFSSAASSVVLWAFLLAACEGTVHRSVRERFAFRGSRAADYGARIKRMESCPPNRRALLQPPAATSDSRTSEPASSNLKRDTYPLWGALPLQPGPEPRVTKRYEIVKGKVYGFEQKFGTLDVLVNIRMTVVVLSPASGGGLLVYSPIASTKQCISMVRELEKKHGSVRHIVLPTTAVEHKVFFGPFSKNFKESELWVAPGQWSFPLNLPLSALGLWPRRAKFLPLDSGECGAEWLAEFDYSILKFSLGLAPFVEAAFYHKPTKSLLVTDSIVFAPSEPPEVLTEDPSALLFRAKDNAKDPTPDTPEVRRKGWGKTVLFSQFLQPEKVSASLIRDYPALLRWDDGWQRSWERVKDTLFVSPVVQILVFAQAPKTVLQWVDRICQWPFDKIIPAHFKAPIPAGPREFRKAFDACIEGASPNSVVEKSVKQGFDFQLPDIFNAKRYRIGLPWKELEGDFALLRNTEKSLRSTGVVKGPKGEYKERS